MISLFQCGEGIRLLSYELDDSEVLHRMSADVGNDGDEIAQRISAQLGDNGDPLLAEEKKLRLSMVGGI